MKPANRKMIKDHKHITISEFVARLRSTPVEGFSGCSIHEFLKEHPLDTDSLEPYLFFSSKGYTRNLICRTDLFELLAICWDIGQVSRIHNHHDQRCWMTVPMGRLQVQNFRVIEQDETRGYCRLDQAEHFEIQKLLPAEVSQHEPVHQVLNLPEFNQRAVSLHIYSKPYDRCLVYAPSANEYQEVQLSNTSEFGRLCPGVKM